MAEGAGEVTYARNQYGLIKPDGIADEVWMALRPLEEWENPWRQSSGRGPAVVDEVEARARAVALAAYVHAKTANG